MNEMEHIDHDTLIAYLYGETDAADRARIDAHLAQCGACGGEVAALADVRTALAAWTPPGVDLAFTVSPPGAPVGGAVAPPWWQTVPVWAQAMAAVLVLAVSAGVANIQVRSGADGFVVTTGWMSAPPASAASAPQAAAGDADWKAAFTALETELRDEIRQGREAVPASAALARGTGDEAIVRRVQELLAASESRQQRELAMRLTQHQRDFDIQRRADLVRLEQSLGQFEGRTVAEQARQRQMINYVMRVSGTPQQ